MLASADRRLSRAIENGDLTAVRSALDAGAHPDRRGPNGERPLTAAAGAPRGTHLARAILQRGAQVNLMNAVWQTPLMIAAAQGRLAMARLLLKAGADADRVNRRQESALTYAVVWRRFKLVDILLQHGADVELPPPPGWSPLMYAALEGDSRVAALLLASGANPQRKDGYGRSARTIALERHPGAVIRLLADPQTCPSD
jgi:uncharacterized protein